MEKACTHPPLHGSAKATEIITHSSVHCRRRFSFFLLRANEQLQYHAQDLLASALPTEKCRRLMHQIAITFHTLSILLFSLLLRDEIRWFIVLLSAMQILLSMCGVFGTRLWMHT